MLPCLTGATIAAYPFRSLFFSRSPCIVPGQLSDVPRLVGYHLGGMPLSVGK